MTRGVEGSSEDRPGLPRPSAEDGRWDVVVVGAGNAALCAAIAARLEGAEVLVLEAAPRERRGGNSWFTDGAIRTAYEDLASLRVVLPEMDDDEARGIVLPPYPTHRFRSDMMAVSHGQCDPDLARVLAEESLATLRWMGDQGVRFGMIYDNQSFERDGRHHFWGGLVVKTLGRGIGLMDALFQRCAELDVPIAYGARARELELVRGGVRLGLESGGEPAHVAGTAVVLACGGFEASPDMRARFLGPEWREALVRGTEFNTGDGLLMALSVGAVAAGDWQGCHAIATDAGAPPTGDRSVPGDVFKKHSYPLGIVVNRDGSRFVDEGADFRNYTYARYGARVLEQPGGVAFQIFDGRVAELLREEYGHPLGTRVEAGSIAELARRLGIDPEGLTRTVARFNEAVGNTPFRPHEKDGKATTGLEPPKSNWANRIDRPPFLGFPVRCAITFTFGGIRIDPTGRALDADARPIPGLYAAGEMVGGLFRGNYPGGAGLMAGATFGRLAGTAAARA